MNHIKSHLAILLLDKIRKTMGDTCCQLINALVLSDDALLFIIEDSIFKAVFINILYCTLLLIISSLLYEKG